MPVLQHLTPRSDQRESKIAFDVAPAGNAHAPSVKSAGINGQITGSRATTIVADDIEIPNNSATEDMREKLIKRVGEFNAILVPETKEVKPRIIFLGTPQTEESVYNKLRDRQYDCRIWPARFPVPKQRLAYNGALAPSLCRELEVDETIIGLPVDPERFDDDDLIEREASYGRSDFALQFMLDTSLSDAERYPLKHGDLICMDLNPHKAPTILQYGSSRDLDIKELPNVGFAGDRFYRPMWFDKDMWKRFEGIVMAIDPSGRGQDETGYAVVAQLHGNLFVLEAGGLKGGYKDDNLTTLAHIAKRNKVREVVIEANFGDGMYTKIFSPVLNKIYPCTIEEVKHSRQKELRIIDTLEPVMNQHRLVMNLSVIRDDIGFLRDRDAVERNQKYSLLYQLTRITKERGSLKHDDRLDALAIAVAYYAESMDRDHQKADDAERARRLDEELKNHIEHCIGRKLTNQSAFLGRFSRR